jgi:DNA-binding NtrC family response regulator
MKTVLVVDDDSELRSIIDEILSMEGFSTRQASDGKEALKVFPSLSPDAVLLDLKMPGMGGIETMEALRRIDTSVPIIILTAFGDIPTAVKAVKMGAYDFVAKPPDFEKLALTVDKAIEKGALQKEIQRVTNVLKSSLENLLGKSAAMKEVIKQVSQVAQTDFSVIIQGETGTGKSFVANTIHSISNRADKPFVRVDISVIPETLVESELFGCIKGAFTGAEKDRPGYFRIANSGTIFIDDIENMSPHIQGKLLGVMEDKKVSPVGNTKSIDVDFRVITATNRDLEECVGEGSFRSDLFYRLGEFMITLPPLRSRTDDIRFFMEKFLLDSCAELNRNVMGFSDEAADILMRHPWPGNIRELKNVVRRATLRAEGDMIEKDCIDFFAVAAIESSSDMSFSLKGATQALEKKMIRQALERQNGNKSRAAIQLGISYPSLLSKIKDYGLA